MSDDKYKSNSIAAGVAYTLVLTYYDSQGNTCDGTIKIAPKQTNPKLALSTGTIALQRNDKYSEGRLDIAVRSPAAAEVSRVEVRPVAVKATGSAPAATHADFFETRKVQDGSWAVGFKTGAGGKAIDGRVAHANPGRSKTTAIKLDVYLVGSDKPMQLAFKVTVE